MIRSSAGRQLFLQELDAACGGPLRQREHDVLRLQLVELVGACAGLPGGLRSLAECLEDLEPGTDQATGILRLADEWQVLELFEEHDVFWLRDELQSRSTSELRRLVVEIRAVHPPVHCETAWQLFAYLAGANAIDGMPPWLLFLEACVELLSVPSTTRLRALITVLAESWGMTEQLVRLHARAPQSEPATGAAYLVIQFEKYGGDDESYIISHWYQWASSVWQPVRGEDKRAHRDGLEIAVDQIVFETERRWADKAGSVIIEFVLPWELLNVPVDMWRTELASPAPMAIAARYPVFVRSLDRLRSPDWHRRWRTRWQRLNDGAIADNRVYYATDGHGDVQLEAILNRDGSVVALVLSEPPVPHGTGQRQALAGLRAGLPVIIWHRDDPLRPDLRETVTSIIADRTSAGLAQLRAHASQLKQEAWSEDPDRPNHHVGYGLVILWDDPDRQPAQVDPVGGITGEVRR
jgi:hypothetical protein